MAKYTADIEIAVRGGQQVNGIIKNLNRLNNSINVVNRNAKLLEGKGFNVASMENYSRAVSKAERALRKAAEGTKQESDAVSALVTAINIENKARERRNFLIAREVANRRRLIATADAGFGVQGPQAAPIRAGRGPASPLRGTATMAGSPAATAVGGRRPTNVAGGKNRLGEALGGGIIGGTFPLLFGQGGGAATGGAIGGVLGALAGPGGSFAGSLLGTLLGDIASKGQAVKDLASDIGFTAQQANALASAFKTANTDLEKFTAVVQNIRGVGLELEDQADAINLITALTEKYGGTWDKIGNAITGSLESGKVSQATLNQLTSQGIDIQSALATKYNVSRDAILTMAKDGNISVQALLDTLVDLGNASTLAAKKVETPFQKAIGETVKLFQDFWREVQTIFSGVSGEGSKAATVLINAFNTWLKDVLFPIGRVLARITALLIKVVSTGVKAAADLVTGFRGLASAIADSFMNIINMIPGLRTIVGLAGQLLNKVAGRRSSDWNDMPWPEGVPKPGSPGMVGRITAPSQLLETGSTGPKAPKDRTANLLDDLNAMRLISITQDGIRDALFEGNKALAIRLEYDQKVYDINRDTNKALREANYETEKSVIRAQQIVRLKDAELEMLDEQRKLQRDINEAIQETFKPLQEGTVWGDQEAYKALADQTIPETLEATREELETLTKPAYQISTAAKSIGDAFAKGFKDIATGSKTAQEALSEFLAKVGEGFIELAARIASLKIIQAIVMPFLGSGLGNFGVDQTGLSFNGSFLSGGSLTGGAFAEGGFVTGPTRALIGEGGESEYVIPASKMQAAMSRYSRGARGEAVIPTSGSGDTGMAEQSAGPTAIDVRYTVERINSVDYVTADQFQRGMQQAAAQGASQGEQRALRKLQQSPSTRRRVGVS